MTQPTELEPCGDDCRAPYCICSHPDDCPCGCADDVQTENEDDDCCGDLDCTDGPWQPADEPCPDGCACAWCTGAVYLTRPSVSTPAASSGVPVNSFTGTDRVPCPRCKGCGQLANTDTQEPWTDWTSVPIGSALAVFLGLVEPIPCTECGGKGERPRSEVFQ